MSTVETTLAARWQAFCARCGANESAARAAWLLLKARYSESHRAYHNLDHLAQCFTEFDRVAAQISDKIACEFALWFHDVIYAPFSSSNEKNSAHLAAKLGRELGVDSSSLKKAERLILATKYHGVSTDVDEQLTLDIDMSILGQDPEAFARYQRGVRREYKWLPDWYFNSKRRGFLEHLLKRERIFQSDEFHSRLEARARENCADAVKALQHATRDEVVVHFDDKKIWTTVTGQLRESIAWSNLDRFVVVTTDSGPIAEDVMFILIGSEGGAIIGQSDEGADSLLKRVMELDGFDYEQFVEAMGSTLNRNFTVWSRKE